MEICHLERTPRSGWSEAEETLLFERARDARERGLSLKGVFEDIARVTGRKPNSIRNYYYSRVKQTESSENFHSAAFVPFGVDEVKNLIRTVLLAQANGVSVRACTLDMGGGDTCRMLRFQNKYRAVVKNDPALVREIMAELESQGLPVFDPYRVKEQRALSAGFDRRDALAFFEALESLAAKYKKLVM